MEWIKNNLKTVITTIVLVMSLSGGILAFDDRYVTAKEFAQAQQQQVQTMKQFQIEQERRFLEQRYQTLTDLMMTQKQLMRKYPQDQELKEDYNAIVKERDEVKQKLNR